MSEAQASTSGVSKKKVQAQAPKTMTHPPTATMVNEAIKTLKARKGTSSQAIRKFIASTYMVDVSKVAHHIRKYLISGVESGQLILVRGIGASGSYKLPPGKTEKKKEPAANSEKTADTSTKPRKQPTAQNKKSSTKSPKAKKTSKPPTQKPKAPKPKKVAGSQTPKKVASKKK